MSVHLELLAWSRKNDRYRDIGTPMCTKAMRKRGSQEYGWLWDSLANWISPAIGPQHSVQTCITNAPQVNAWPFRDALGPGRHVIAATISLLEKMQRVAGLVASTAESASDTDGSMSMLGKLLPARDMTSEDYQAFAELVAQACLVHLFTHEFAHLHNGHAGCAAASHDVLTWWSKKQVDTKLRQRAIEFDADASAFAWTDLFYSGFNESKVKSEQLGRVRTRVITSCLSTQEGRLFIASLGAIVFNLVVASFPEPENSTHPRFEERIRLARIASGSMAIGAGIPAGIDLAACAFCLAMVTRDSLSEGDKRVLVGTGDLRVSRPRLSDLGGPLACAPGVDSLTSEEKIKHRAMAKEILAMEGELVNRRILSTLRKVDWWSMELDQSNTQARTPC